MTSTTQPLAATSSIQSTNIQTAPGIDLSASQRTLVGCVFDLFGGKATPDKLKLWTDDAVFEDPLAIAKGREQYEAQWYGLQAAFSEINQESHKVISAGNPIELEMTTRYVIKGIHKEQTIKSLVKIYTKGDFIEKVEDKWDGKLPESGIANVSSVFQLMSPWWWARYVEGWVFWCWSWTWETGVWRAFRRLNGRTMPTFVSGPKDDK